MTTLPSTDTTTASHEPGDRCQSLATLRPVAASRRTFLRWGAGALGAVAAAGTLAACGTEIVQTPPLATVPPVDQPTGTPAHGSAHNAAPLLDPTAAPANEWQVMDAMHEAGVKAFPAKTAGLGMQPLAPRIENGVKVFELTCEKIMWEVEVGKHLEAWTYNRQLPGPEIRVTEGDTVRLIVTNKLDQSTAVHLHGVMVPNAMDGVPYITQPPITPGATFTYEFVAKNPGSHMYHAHHNSTRQVSMGLLGPFIIEPKDKQQDPAYDRDYTLILNDSAHGMTLNGKGFPATAPLTAKLGEKIRIRYMNEGMMIHPMHLHGLPQLVFAKDGWNLPQPFRCDTINVAPGERWDVIVDCSEPGVWAFHCHILAHAENEHGMFGMVTVLAIEA